MGTSLSTQNLRSDGEIVAALTVVCGLVCRRKLDDHEIAYVFSRLEATNHEYLLQAIHRIGDTAENVGNPIAAIREMVGIIARNDREAKESRLRQEEADSIPIEKQKEMAENTRAMIAKLSRGPHA